MNPIRLHMKAAQRRLREVEENLRQDQHQLKQYLQELHSIYPPKHQYDRKNKKEKFAYYSYWERIEDLKDNIDRTEDNITRWIYIKNKLLNRSLQLSCAA